MRNHFAILILVAIGFLFYSTALSANDDIQAAVFANTCAGCHGTDGKSNGSIPAISSFSGSYISSAMKAFKTDKRRGTVMNRIAKGYTDQEIELMSKHFDNIKKK